MGFSGCGKEEAARAPDSEAPAAGVASQLPPEDVTSKPGDSLIKEPGQDFPVEGLYLSPFFDDEGRQTELTVKPGQQFKVNIFAETVEPYTTVAFQCRVMLPEGVRVLGTDEFEQKNISTGNYAVNYMMQYDCHPVGRFRVVTYLCVAEPGFKGGEVRVLEGILGSGISFIGFVSCELVELRATGGVATLKASK